MKTSTRQQLLADKKQEILSLAKKHGIVDVRVFGSVARGDDRADSDIYFLINTGDKKGLFGWFGFWADVEDVLQQKIDVIPEKNLKAYIKPQVLAEAKYL